jgi:hypothetical protein
MVIMSVPSRAGGEEIPGNGVGAEIRRLRTSQSAAPGLAHFSSSLHRQITLTKRTNVSCSYSEGENKELKRYGGGGGKEEIQ